MAKKFSKRRQTDRRGAKHTAGGQRAGGQLPNVAVFQVVGIDDDGEPIARWLGHRGESAADGPKVLLQSGGRGTRAPGVGERVLARLTRQSRGDHRAQIIKVLPSEPDRVVGVLERGAGGLRVRPIGRRARQEMAIHESDAGGAGPGDVIVAERSPGAALAPGRARVSERLGRADDPGAISLVAAHHFDLPIAFPAEAEAAAERAEPVTPGDRRDLRDLPLITIDGADARDFDDAVWAAPDDGPKNPGGWQIVVAIADVAHYVRPGDALDQEARRRGNSVYFPDRVLPMLPEALSNGLCSLRPEEDRACLAAHLRIDRNGRLIGHRFERALMRSSARLTYEQVQSASDGAPDAATAPLLDPVLRPLYGAFAALIEARDRRGTLDLDLPEVALRLDPEGRPQAIDARPRLDAHRLIEEFMVAANVAAAETLERAVMPCLYRIHDRPDPAKLEALMPLLEALGLGAGRGSLAQPKDLARLLERTKGDPLAPLLGNLILRAQQQAVYSPDNVGHFGLNLGRYAHFTSPIRRYADLVIHRALIRAQKLGQGGLDPGAAHELDELGRHLSRCERRAVEAERSATDRFVTWFLAEQVGSAFSAIVINVERFGLFVQLDETLADGLIPVSTLGREYFTHDSRHRALVGDSGTIFAVGDRTRVELAEVDRVVGQLTFRLLEHTPGPAAKAAAKASSHRSGRRGGGRTMRR